MNAVRIHIVLLILLIASCSPALPTEPAVRAEEQSELERYFQGFEGAFVLYDLQNDRYTRYNPAQCAERLLPASTFKILNALIALETEPSRMKIMSSPGMVRTMRSGPGTRTIH